jgi:hypothetical protein
VFRVSISCSFIPVGQAAQTTLRPAPPQNPITD